MHYFSCGRQGIAADLLSHVLEKAQEDPSIVEAYLHGIPPYYRNL